MKDERLNNIFVDERSARDIDGQVAKLLRDLDVREPPLRLELVREALALDKAFYSATDTSVLQETVHRLTVAGKQILKRPSLLIDIVRKRELKALWVPDRKRILIDSELPDSKQRWAEAHEITHSLIPWHEIVMHGDHKRTLSPSCEHVIETEANYGAGRLLFLQGAFTDRLFGSELTFARIRELSTEFGNTITSTLWRAVETMPQPAFGLVSAHPKRTPPSAAEDHIRYYLRSPVFAEQFAGVPATMLFAEIKRKCFGNRGPIGNGELVLTDTNGVEHTFHFEAFFNGHEALTLGVYRRLRPLVVSA